jgi:hypothetical protein
MNRAKGCGDHLGIAVSTQEFSHLFPAFGESSPYNFGKFYRIGLLKLARLSSRQQKNN